MNNEINIKGIDIEMLDDGSQDKFVMTINDEILGGTESGYVRYNGADYDWEIIDDSTKLLEQIESLSYENKMMSEALEALGYTQEQIVDICTGDISFIKNCSLKNDNNTDNNISDYILKDESCWITVEDLSVYIQNTEDGVAVDIYPLDDETSYPLASTYAEFSEKIITIYDKRKCLK